MGIEEERALRSRARALAAEAAATGDETGWFERLYTEAEAGGAVVPWADGETNPHLTEWAARERLDGAGKRALVVGCGLGYDAEFLARLGYAVTGFDVAPTAIEWAIRENPGSPVEYVTADLLDLPAGWTGAFDLVVEIYTVQPLFGRSASGPWPHWRPRSPRGERCWSSPAPSTRRTRSATRR